LETAGDPLNRIAAAYVMVLARPASEDEVRAGVEYLRLFEEKAKADNISDVKALTSFVRALFASNEFMFID
jgi:hypothetical protein